MVYFKNDWAAAAALGRNPGSVPGYLGNDDMAAFWKLDNYILNYRKDNPKYPSQHELLRFTLQDAKDLLTGSNYSVGKNVTKTRVIELINRMQRGLMSYDACTTSELQMFIRDRGLSQPSAMMPRSKAKLMDILEKEDESPTFTRLMDLPAELRVRIYSLYYKGFSRAITPREPPLAQVSRQVRTEALPLFYSTCIFKLLICKYPGLVHKKARICRRHESFDAVDDRNVALITALRVDLWPHVQYNNEWGYSIDGMWSINLDIDGNGTVSVMVEDEIFEDHGPNYEPERHRQWLGPITDGLNVAVNEISQRSAKRKLRKEDIKSFTDVIEPLVRIRRDMYTS